MGLKLCRETLAPGLPVHNNEVNKNDRLKLKLLGGLSGTIITFSGFFFSSLYSQRTWSSGNSKLTVARYAASSNVTAGNQDAVHSASSASRSKYSWTIPEVVGMVVAFVLVPAMTMWFNYYLYGRTKKDRKNEKEKEEAEEKRREEAKEKRRDEEEKKRREEKVTDRRERKLERRQKAAKEKKRREEKVTDRRERKLERRREDAKEKKRREEKVTDRRERMELKRRQEDAKDQRQRSWIQH